MLHRAVIFVVCTVSEFASLTSSDHAFSLSHDLFDGQLDGTQSVKQESDALDNLCIDAFDLAGFANANSACGTMTTMLSQSAANQSSAMTTTGGFSNSAVDTSASSQLQFLVQKPQIVVPPNPTSAISIADLLRPQEIAPSGIVTSLQLSEESKVSPTTTTTLDLSSPVTLELLAQAGIQQPVKRQIQLHSELAQHITTQKPLKVLWSISTNFSFAANRVAVFRESPVSPAGNRQPIPRDPLPPAIYDSLAPKPSLNLH